MRQERLSWTSIEVRLSRRGMKADNRICSAAFASHIVYIAYSLGVEKALTRKKPYEGRRSGLSSHYGSDDQSVSYQKHVIQLPVAMYMA